MKIILVSCTLPSRRRLHLSASQADMPPPPPPACSWHSPAAWGGYEALPVSDPWRERSLHSGRTGKHGTEPFQIKGPRPAWKPLLESFDPAALPMFGHRGAPGHNPGALVARGLPSSVLLTCLRSDNHLCTPRGHLDPEGRQRSGPLRMVWPDHPFQPLQAPSVQGNGSHPKRR